MKHIQDLIKRHRKWEEQDERTRVDRAQEGHHPFAPGTKQPCDPSFCPPYRPRNNEEKEFWDICDKILRWTNKACKLPNAYWSYDYHKSQGGDPNVRRTTFYRAVRAVWGKSQTQYFSCAFLDRWNDTLYIPAYFIKMNRTDIATATLCMMNRQWKGIDHLLYNLIRERMENYASGKRDHLGPKNGSQHRKMLGDKAR